MPKLPNLEETERAFNHFRTHNAPQTFKRDGILWRCRINGDGLRELAVWAESGIPPEDGFDPELPYTFERIEHEKYLIYREKPPQTPMPAPEPPAPVVPSGEFRPGKPAPQNLSECVSGLLYHAETARGLITFSRTDNGVFLWRGLRPDPYLYGSGGASDLQAYLQNNPPSVHTE